MMHCARSRIHSPRRKQSAFATVDRLVRCERGSQIVGFALVAPLIVYLAIATMQITAVALSKVTLTTATQAAARDFATRGGSEIKSRQTADRLLKISGLSDCGKTFTFNRRKVSGVSLVQVKITQCVRLTSLNQTVHLVSSAQSVDESKL